MSTKTVIFDLDGTLLNTIGDLAVSCNVMLSKRSLNEHTYDEYCHFVGNGITRLVERALPEHLRTEEYIASARRDFLDHYIAHIDIHTRPYDGIRELLAHLQDEGVNLAVASNKFNDGTRKLMAEFFPDIRFAAVYGNRDGVPFKPHPHVLYEIMEQCGSSAEECCMVGDSGVDMQTAHNAGVRSIGVAWGFRAREELVENRAMRIVDSPAEIIPVLREFGIL